MCKCDVKTENRKGILFLKERGHTRRMEEGGWQGVTEKSTMMHTYEGAIRKSIISYGN